MPFRHVTTLVVKLSLAMLFAPGAQAAWLNVSSYGADNSTCGASSSPCKTLQQAATNAHSGDWILITPNGQDAGPAKITKSVNIVGSIAAGVYSPGKPCLQIAAGSSDVVSVTQFICDQAGGAAHGIQFDSGKALRLDNVEIRNGTGTNCGILFGPHADAELLIQNTTVSGFGTSGNGGGICVTPHASHSASVTANRVNLQANRFGIYASGSNGTIKLTLSTSNVTTNSGTGIFSSGQSSVAVKNSTIAGNAVGLGHSSGGDVISLGGNALGANTEDGTFTETMKPE